MHGASGGAWTFRLGRWRGVEVRLHILFPLLAIAALAVTSLPAEYGMLFQPISPGAMCLGLAVLLVSVVLHEAAKATAARRVGGRTPLVVLGPWGSGAQPILPADPPAYLVTAVTGPLTYLAVAVSAACLLVFIGDRHLVDVIDPFDPKFTGGDSRLHLTLQLCVWINFWLLMINLMPVSPLDGAEVLKGLLWPLVGRASAAIAASHIAYGAAVVTAVLAIAVQHFTVNDFIPAWFPMAVASVVLLYGGSRTARQGHYDAGLEIDELESDDEQWLSPDWLEDERAAVLVERLEEKQQEVLNKKRREREDREDARVDDILARLQEVGMEKLSDEERAILKRASRRYRQRQQRPSHES